MLSAPHYQCHLFEVSVEVGEVEELNAAPVM